jgi:hypothetical protein
MRVVSYPILLESFVMSPTISQDSRLKWQQRIHAQKAVTVHQSRV